MVTTTSSVWGVLPDIIGTGAAEQQQIMTIICEAKGAAFDGTDCVGELNDSSVVVRVESAGCRQEGHLAHVSTNRMLSLVLILLRATVKQLRAETENAFHNRAHRNIIVQHAMFA